MCMCIYMLRVSTVAHETQKRVSDPWARVIGCHEAQIQFLSKKVMCTLGSWACLATPLRPSVHWLVVFRLSRETYRLWYIHLLKKPNWRDSSIDKALAIKSWRPESPCKGWVGVAATVVPVLGSQRQGIHRVSWRAMLIGTSKLWILRDALPPWKMSMI